MLASWQVLQLLNRKKDGIRSRAVLQMLGYAKGSTPPPQAVKEFLDSFKTGFYDAQLAEAAGIRELGDKFSGSVASRIAYLSAAITTWTGKSKDEPLDLLMAWPWFVERLTPLRAVVEVPVPAAPSADGAPPAVVAAVGSEVIRTATRTPHKRLLCWMPI